MKKIVVLFFVIFVNIAFATSDNAGGSKWYNLSAEKKAIYAEVFMLGQSQINKKVSQGGLNHILGV